VITVTSGILMTSRRIHSTTTHRVDLQAASRQTMAMMTSELRNAGADPSEPPVGITALVTADSATVHIRSDLNGNGSIQTAEPSEDVTYQFNKGPGTITRNPGSGAVIILDKVTNMRLSYFDGNGTPLTVLPLSASDAALVRSIGITMTCTEGDAQPLTLTTRISLRNLIQ
jgi:Tfp pilus assembly protein PilW